MEKRRKNLLLIIPKRKDSMTVLQPQTDYVEIYVRKGKKMDREEIELYGELPTPDENTAAAKHNVSPAVIRRLPRYFRYLRELIRNGKMRISSGELSKMMNVTASQIRQDLNCFGGFGQQGYGYNVKYLYAKISEILGVNRNFRAVIIGAGNIGRALVRNPMFTKRGVSTVAMFDIDASVIGNTVSGIMIHDMREFEDFCRDNDIDIAVLTLPKECAQETVNRLVGAGVNGIWNFTGKELEVPSDRVKVVNVHLGDSLMELCYELNRRDYEKNSLQSENNKGEL